ncbi:MAG: hypothetical protein CVU09_00435 [Bacteroidetes bacterium HGW-Bacteroidetes-4]|jgi:hypothetical protein|nr:MAG: hypothetical protein CVU09_00435 [Bacteroidetes bacterium HGW-Bacteroidetes-4]
MQELLETIKQDFKDHSEKLGGLSSNDKLTIFNYHTLHLQVLNPTPQDEETLWQLRQRLLLK